MLLTGDSGMLSVRYNDFLSIIIKSIQERQQLIEKRKSQIRKLEKSIENLEKKYAYTNALITFCNNIFPNWVKFICIAGLVLEKTTYFKK